MNYKFLLFSILILTTHFSEAQDEIRTATKLEEMNNDTIGYINEYIIGRKDYYIGKPLDTLLRDMPLPLRSCVNEMKPRDRFTSSFTVFYFYNYWKKNSYANLLVTWQSALDKRELDRAGLSTPGGKWTQATQDYYKNRIIKDIEMFTTHKQIPGSTDY